ncbi:MAG TPA: DUF6129 family protein [Gammaproteobacteria bacterium]
MINTALVQQIADCYASNRNDPAVLSSLRDGFPQVRFTHCNDDELGHAKPILECEGFNLYLMGGEHCLSIISDFTDAKGIVVADVYDDE